MIKDQTTSGFQGLLVGALESRMASEMERLITRYGGQPVVAPSMKERPVSENTQALDFAQNLLSGHIDMVIVLTGIGLRTLLDSIQSHYSKETIIAAFKKCVIVARGPKPIAVLRKIGLHPNLVVPEPNTWKDILSALDASYVGGLIGMKVAVQEYGVSNPELLAGLTQRGAEVQAVPVYRWTLPDDLHPLENLLNQIIDGQVSVLLVTNAVQVDHLLKVLGTDSRINSFKKSLNHIMVASIGQVASERLRLHGFPVDLEPSHPKMGIFVKEASQSAHEILQIKKRMT